MGGLLDVARHSSVTQWLLITSHTRTD